MEVPGDRFTAMERQIADLVHSMVAVERHVAQATAPRDPPHRLENREYSATHSPRHHVLPPPRERNHRSLSRSPTPHYLRGRDRSRPDHGYLQRRPASPRGFGSPEPYWDHPSPRHRPPRRDSPQSRPPRHYPYERSPPRYRSPRDYQLRGRSPRRHRSPESYHGERVSDRERVLTHVKMRTSPFIRGNAGGPAPEKFQPPNIRYYDGTTDPYEHVERYCAEIMTNGLNEVVLCRAFPKTLTGIAYDWFRSLPLESIASFRRLTELFFRRFANRRRQMKNPVLLLRCKQMEGESLRDYLDRFREA
ncbi:hypothetical protein J5N97_018886 [Dioscorea zingiberensis]|uniref:Retrotransposon gag domain-containing protein n=1 Tax=Dioscorea zingiberensis TaxID=325984 RepID=A0A9D5CD00_9LILI|nr:hypothetical protein J5N97_018886 [Dioscorea zingiberensis]